MNSINLFWGVVALAVSANLLAALGFRGIMQGYQPWKFYTAYICGVTLAIMSCIASCVFIISVIGLPAFWLFIGIFVQTVLACVFICFWRVKKPQASYLDDVRPTQEEYNDTDQELVVDRKWDDVPF